MRTLVSMSKAYGDYLSGRRRKLLARIPKGECLDAHLPMAERVVKDVLPFLRGEERHQLVRIVAWGMSRPVVHMSSAQRFISRCEVVNGTRTDT